MALLKHIQFSEGKVFIDELKMENKVEANMNEFTYNFADDLKIVTEEDKLKKEQAVLRKEENFKQL